MTKLYINTLLMWQNREEGATAAEYGLLVALVAVVIIGGVTALGGSLSDAFNAVSERIDAEVP